MNNNLNDQEFLQMIKNSLDESTSQQDVSISNRLQLARQSALLPKNKQVKTRWLGALAVSVLLVTMLWHSKPDPVLPDDDQIVEELLMTDDNQDLLLNLEFYSWLENSQSHG